MESEDCYIVLNYGSDNESRVEMPYGEPFTIEFFTYHGNVIFSSPNWCKGALYRVGD